MKIPKEHYPVLYEIWTRKLQDLSTKYEEFTSMYGPSRILFEDNLMRKLDEFDKKIQGIKTALYLSIELKNKEDYFDRLPEEYWGGYIELLSEIEIEFKSLL